MDNSIFGTLFDATVDVVLETSVQRNNDRILAGIGDDFFSLALSDLDVQFGC